MLARHLALIFVLMNFQSFSFSSWDSTGNLLNTRTFKEFNLFLSRRCFPWLPSVLLVHNSSLVKKNGRSLTAHLYLECSPCKVVWTACTFLGVTQVSITSLPIGDRSNSLSVGGRAGSNGVDGWTFGAALSSSLKASKASMSIVGKSSWDGILAAKAVNEQSKLSWRLNYGYKKTIPLSPIC